MSRLVNPSGYTFDQGGGTLFDLPPEVDVRIRARPERALRFERQIAGDAADAEADDEEARGLEEVAAYLKTQGFAT